MTTGMWLMAKATNAAVVAGIFAFRAFSRLPCAGIVLDTILGPAEDFDYVSTTSPPVKPPTQ